MQSVGNTARVLSRGGSPSKPHVVVRVNKTNEGNASFELVCERSIDTSSESPIDVGGFSIDELIGGSRRRPLVTARQISMYIFRELTELSYPAIAKEFGGRDHTTVIHAVDKISQLMAERREIYDQVTALTTAVKSRN